VAEVLARGAAEASQRIADLFEREDVPYAIGGALALAVAGVPRGTADVDVNVFVDDARLPEVLSHLERLGMVVEPGASIARARRDGMFVARWDGMRIDADGTSWSADSLEPRRTSARARWDPGPTAATPVDHAAENAAAGMSIALRSPLWSIFAFATTSGSMLFAKNSAACFLPS
jgi:hypothetical protein